MIGIAVLGVAAGLFTVVVAAIGVALGKEFFPSQPFQGAFAWMTFAFLSVVVLLMDAVIHAFFAAVAVEDATAPDGEPDEGQAAAPQTPLPASFRRWRMETVSTADGEWYARVWTESRLAWKGNKFERRSDAEDQALEWFVGNMPHARGGGMEAEKPCP